MDSYCYNNTFSPCCSDVPRVSFHSVYAVNTAVQRSAAESAAILAEYMRIDTYLKIS